MSHVPMKYKKPRVKKKKLNISFLASNNRSSDSFNNLLGGELLLAQFCGGCSSGCCTCTSCTQGGGGT